MTEAKKEIWIYTDGSSSGNPGPGGFGTILVFGQYHKKISGGFRLTTNNRMELLAVIEGLKAIKNKEYPVIVVSDSKYVCDSVTKKWVLGWEKKGFAGKKNPDLWREFLKYYRQFDITFKWIKGHNGHAYNEACDEMAVEAGKKKNLPPDIGYERESNTLV